MEYLIQMITVNLMILMDGIKVAFILTQVLLIKLRISLHKGGTHNGVTVKGIGEDKMFDIFYYANTDELNMTSNFKELRSACIRVATNKYGANTAEVQAVQKAFDAAKIK